MSQYLNRWMLVKCFLYFVKAQESTLKLSVNLKMWLEIIPQKACSSPVQIKTC